jgi:CheY-like chemotaxis protein
MPDDIWQCRIDPAHIAQVISSIVLNARHAMMNGGLVLISIENIRHDHRQHHTLSSGPYVLITIRDTGGGIAAEHLSQVFDPFFTTHAGRSGLGLSSSYTIIKKHNGLIDIVSEPGVGTSVYIYLPGLPEGNLSAAAEPAHPAGSVKTVLLVEEDTSVRETTAALLKEFGYSVTAVSTGLEAAQKYQEAITRGTRFDVVILDLSPIGREGGRGCLKTLLSIDAHACVIGGSRYAESFDLAEYRQYGFAHVAKKPYNIEQLLAILRQALEGIA